MSQWIDEWSEVAACRTADPDELFVQGPAQARAKAVCTGCPVRTECLADALDNRVEWGVWGGMTERERTALLARRPTVTSWRTLLKTARTEYESSAKIMVLERTDIADEFRNMPVPVPDDWPAGHLISEGVQPTPGPDRSAEQYEAFFRERFTSAVGLLIVAGADRHSAEDAVQSAFVELNRVWSSVTYPHAWLRTTAWRMWLKAKGKEATWSSDPHDLPDIPVRDRSGDVVEQIDLVQLLGRLPILQRTVMAFEIDGSTSAETAEALSMPAPNVRQNLLRARRNLNRMLQEEDAGGAV